MVCLIQLCFDIVIVVKQWMFSTVLWTRALSLLSLSTLASRSLSTTSFQRSPRSMNPTIPAQLSASFTRWSTMILNFCSEWRAFASHNHSLLAPARFAQTSFPSVTSISVSFQCIATTQMALAQQHQLIAILLANETYTLPPALLKHVMAGTLFTKTTEACAAQLDPAWFIDNLPKLPKDGELQFWLALGSTAMASFQQSNCQQLPPQKVLGSANANLGNWQASSSFAKAVSFWAWTACRAPELLKEKAHILSFSFPVSKFVAHHKMMKLGNTVTLDFRAQTVSFASGANSLLGSNTSSWELAYPSWPSCQA